MSLTQVCAADAPQGLANSEGAERGSINVPSRHFIPILLTVVSQELTPVTDCLVEAKKLEAEGKAPPVTLDMDGR